MNDDYQLINLITILSSMVFNSVPIGLWPLTASLPLLPVGGIPPASYDLSRAQWDMMKLFRTRMIHHVKLVNDSQWLLFLILHAAIIVINYYYHYYHALKPPASYSKSEIMVGILKNQHKEDITNRNGMNNTWIMCASVWMDGCMHHSTGVDAKMIGTKPVNVNRIEAEIAGEILGPPGFDHSSFEVNHIIAFPISTVQNQWYWL